uniref:S1 motif domain-containing protein n=1 Tax=Kalanchoe fedtschenkoi TaxID=63787 RepID=A0A7N0TWG4_KALFE
MSLKVIQADEIKRRLIFSEKEAAWLKFSKTIKVGDVFDAKVGVVEDYGAFAHLLFPDGLYHLTGLVHVSEVSWDLVQDVRDILSEGDQVRVKVVNIDSKKSRITLSIKQLQEDPLLETLDKVITQNGPVILKSSNLEGDYKIEPLPGLETILEELCMEEGISDVKIRRQGFEARVVSPDLQLWLSNAPAVDSKLIKRKATCFRTLDWTWSLSGQIPCKRLGWRCQRFNPGDLPNITAHCELRISKGRSRSVHTLLHQLAAHVQVLAEMHAPRAELPFDFAPTLQPQHDCSADPEVAPQEYVQHANQLDCSAVFERYVGLASKAISS